MIRRLVLILLSLGLPLMGQPTRVAIETELSLRVDQERLDALLVNSYPNERSASWEMCFETVVR